MLSPRSPVLVRLVTASALCASLAAVPALSEELVLGDDPTVVNTTTANDQGFPSVAVQTDGRYAVAWESDVQDGSGFGVFARIFEADGTPVTGEIQINTNTVDDQWDASIAATPTGGYVVTWRSFGQDGSGFGVYARRMGGDGTLMGGEIGVNTFTTGDQEFPDVAVAPSDGRFMIVWESDGQLSNFSEIYGRIFSDVGVALTDEILINTTTTDEQNDPRVAATANGFVAAWESDAVDGNGEAVVIRTFDLDGVATSSEIQVNSSTVSNQENADVAVLADGTIGVAWESEGQDGDGEAIIARLFGADLMPLSGEIPMNVLTAGDQASPRIAALDAEHFGVMWSGDGGPNLEDVWVRLLDATGQALGAQETLLSESLPDVDTEPAIEGNGSGFGVVSWFNIELSTDADVYAQRLEVALFADGFESGDVSAWSSSMP